MPTAPADLKTTLIVGMEIHVELATRSKMWTSAPNVAHRDYFDAEPNTLLDPVVIGMPGVLPVINEQAIEMAVRVGLALGCEIAKKTSGGSQNMVPQRRGWAPNGAKPEFGSG